MLRGMFGSEREEVAGGIMRSFIICMLHHMLLG
jgi:hypothetical protein